MRPREQVFLPAQLLQRNQEQQQHVFSSALQLNADLQQQKQQRRQMSAQSTSPSSSTASSCMLLPAVPWDGTARAAPLLQDNGSACVGTPLALHQPQLSGRSPSLPASSLQLGGSVSESGTTPLRPGWDAGRTNSSPGLLPVPPASRTGTAAGGPSWPWPEGAAGPDTGSLMSKAGAGGVWEGPAGPRAKGGQGGQAKALSLQPRPVEHAMESDRRARFSSTDWC